MEKLLLMNYYAPKGSKVVIVMHKRPDGDCLASALMLQKLLIHLGFSKENIFVLDGEGQNELFKALKNELQPIDDIPTDSSVYFVDHSTPELSLLWDGNHPNIVHKCLFDHHFTDEVLKKYKMHFELDIYAPCTTGIIYRMFIHIIEQMDEDLKSDIASLVYTGLFYDYSRFCKGFTDEMLERIVELYQMGARPSKYRVIGFVNYMANEKRLGRAMSLCTKCRNVPVVKVDFTKSLATLHYFQKVEFNPEDLYRRLFMCRAVEHLFIVNFIDPKNETAPYRVSIRSTNFDALKRFFKKHNKIDSTKFRCETEQEVGKMYLSFCAHIAAYRQKNASKNPESIEQVQ